MIVPHTIFYLDGTKEETTKEVPDDYFPETADFYIPTAEDRLAALERAMLSMMGVSTDV